MQQSTDEAYEAVISLEGVSKCFRRYDHPIDRLKEVLAANRSKGQEFWALNDINLKVYRGETLGFIGQNGSGKSTVLQIIAGTLQPTQGSVSVQGRVSALLELGSGFNPDFTGRQNVFFNGRILGLTQKEIRAKFDEIAAFAGIGDFIEQPVKTYSSGMFVRLAFAVAVHVDPEILIVDEALSVGDGVFVHRCMAKIKEFQDRGGTILFVSHDVGAVTRLCSRVAWINNGQLRSVGDPSEIVREYQAWMYDQINASYQRDHPHKEAPKLDSTSDPSLREEPQSLSDRSTRSEVNNPFTQKPYQNFRDVKRFGTGRAEIVEFDVLDSVGNPSNFAHPGDDVCLVIKSIAFDQIDRPIVGIMIYDRLRTEIAGFNTYQLKTEVSAISEGTLLEVKFKFPWPELKGGNYTLEAAFAEGSQDSHEMLDWLQCPLSLFSGETDLTFGMIRIPEIQSSYEVI
jgi:lipopolysaccharide transport system ATP-binding protein